MLFQFAGSGNLNWPLEKNFLKTFLGVKNVQNVHKSPLKGKCSDK